jgi:hypothetical protein
METLDGNGARSSIKFVISLCVCDKLQIAFSLSELQSLGVIERASSPTFILRCGMMESVLSHSTPICKII